MGFRYIDRVITPENLQKFLELADNAAGAGQDVNNVFDLSDKLNGSRPMGVCLKAIKQDAASLALLEERYVGPLYDLKAMLEMPKGSLGWTYGRIMDAMGYDPQFYRIPDRFESEAAYVNFRVYKTHDIHHVLTGYSMDGFGELGVISVFAGQIGFPAFVFVDLLSMLMSFFASDELYTEAETPIEQARTLGYKFRIISDGIEMGMQAKRLFPVKWEEILDQPLDELRSQFQIEPVTEGIFSWYNDPKLQSAIA